MNKIELKRTSDYSAFKKLLGNRGVEQSRVEKIVSSIKKVGYVTNPLIVNERMEIIDGQGRFEALKSLEMPIDYIVVEGVGKNECIAMNVNQSNWKIIDYINSHADTGNMHYINLRDLVNKFPKLPIDVIIMAARNSGITKGSGIKEGFEFKVEFNDAYRELQTLNLFADIPYSGRNSVYFWALHFIYKNSGVDMLEFEKKLRKHYNILAPFTNTRECLAAMSEVYNRKLSAQNRVYWDFDFLKSGKKA